MGKKGKTNHRRGGPKYVANADEIDARNTREAVTDAERAKRRAAAAEGGDAAANSDDDNPFAAPEPVEKQQPQKSSKPKGASGVIEVSNPNAVKQKFTKIKDIGKASADNPDGEPRLTRREREELETVRKKEAYQKLHKEGKTDEFKADMERLKSIRARREESETNVKKVEDSRKAAEDEMKKAAAEVHAADEGTVKLDPREIKKMNPKTIKEHLKERGQPLHGQKKELIARLLACN